jgi:ATP synthase F0, B subunit
MSLITPDFGLFFWMTIVFLIVFFILWKKGFPVIINMVEERKAYIDASLQKAHEANERLANIKREGESILQEAREKQTKILKEAAETRDKMIEEARVKAREEANRMLMEAKMQIEAEKQNALSDVKSSVATISVQVAEKILHQKLSTADVQMDLIDSVLSKVSVQDK